MKENLVSIITPMYNSGKFIRNTIESVLNQTYEDWEMIIVDDCSKDESPEIVKSYTKKDERIKYIRVSENKGVSNARNVALKNASGRYIAFLDSDDIWETTKLEKQIRFMKEKNCAISFTSYELINEENQKLNKVVRVPKSVDYKTLLKGNVLGCLTVVIDKSKLNFDIKMSGVRHEDYVLWLSILKRGYIAYGLDEVLAQYRKSLTSLSGNKIKSAMWTWNIYRNIEKIPLHKSIYYFVNYSINGIKKS
ncbi:glycosyltransferase family 2 protein [Romboutsia hominis]|uniref:Glycosyl transferase 2 n=1 Tax=Romboutsia hominis TaxID=1507512 RepID=A0A2P2BXH6_9FIRM|nr:glycosyltransferase family 2 protein [Romboutsia hominis]MCH1961140.1 glycosyltransferase [Romboutsia hominis]MCH1968435.1 glycosyltransferase [Romboutsia hominis]CEI73874.1 Glycosyl transferase 2 [Romboutsia hominis]